MILRQIMLIIALGIVFTGFVKAQTNNATPSDTSTFKPSGKLWGLTFGDLAWKEHADALDRGATQYSGSSFPQNYSSFEFRRIYLGYDYDIRRQFTAQVLLAYESPYPSGATADVDAGSNRVLYLKAANIRWKGIFKHSDLIIGQQATPSTTLVSTVLWGYRSIERTISDMRSIAKTYDFGASLQGNDSKGNIGYHVLVSDGNGTKLPTTPFRKFSGDIFARFLHQRFVIDAYADYQRLQLLPFEEHNVTYKGLVAWQSKTITIGIEYFVQMQYNQLTTIATKTKTATDTGNIVPSGFSIFVHGPIYKDKLVFFVRYDTYDPDDNYNSTIFAKTVGSSSVTQVFITAGLDWSPNKNIHIIPNIWYDAFHDNKPGATGTDLNDYDLVPRLTFYYTFNAAGLDKIQTH